MYDDDNGSLRSAAQLATPELTRVILEIIFKASPLTLGQIRDELLASSIFMSPEGEFLYRQDRTSLTLELDDLIETNGADTLARSVLPA